MTESTATAAAPPANGATILGHPRGLYTLFFTEMWERFSYYGMRALLVLFLVEAVEKGGFGLTDKTATAIYGLYTAGVYFMSLPGGWVADRLIGAQRAVLWGGVTIMIGHVLLGLAVAPALFYLGLLVIVFGTGLLKPNVGALVAELYPEGGGRRDAGYTIYYFSVNFGATLGQIVTGALVAWVSWSAGFFAAAVAMAFGVAQFIAMRKHLGQAGARPSASDAVGASIQARWAWMVLVVIVVMVALLFSGVVPFEPVTVARYTAWFILALAVAVFVYLFFFAGLDALGRRRVIVLAVLFAASSFFWAGFEQTGSSLNLFAQRYTDRVIDRFHFEIPAPWFQSVNTSFILVFALPFAAFWQWLSNRNRDWSLATKMALGLLFLGSGFLVMAGAANFIAHGEQVAPFWLITTYLLHTYGELCLSPIGQSAFSKLVPPRLVGLIMGLWFVTISFGNLVAGLIAGGFDPENLSTMQNQFMDLVWYAILPGVVLLALAKPLQRLAGGVR